jgi:hypothetical protein
MYVGCDGSLTRGDEEEEEEEEEEDEEKKEVGFDDGGGPTIMYVSQERRCILRSQSF